MQSKSFKLFIILILTLSLALFISGTRLLNLFSNPDIFSIEETYSEEDPTSTVENQIRKEIQSQKESALVYLLNETLIENVRLSKDGEWAAAWLTPIDPETGEIIPAEPGLVILHFDGADWKVALPSYPIWSSYINEVPDDLLPADLKTQWIEKSIAQAELTSGLGTFSGYYLPFAGGETLYMTQSVKHDAYTPSEAAHYAFDFARGGYPSAMFNVHAAKGGRVHKAAWSYENGNPMYTNLLVLEDTTTVPTTYQLYMHLAKDSIPVEFRQKGAYVGQGQFIGVADDTGVSSGNHLHFQVHTNPDSYWGRSVDITFEEVFINGGRPRMKGDLKYCKNDGTFQDVCEETSYTYTSRNFPNPDYILPTGDITSPVTGAVVDQGTIEIDGWASDEGTGIKSVQIIAKYSGAWQPIGEVFDTDQFSMVWDLCEFQVPDGPVSLALEIEDHYFNQASGLPGLTHLLKDYSCPVEPPQCQPSTDEIAVFSGTDFTGECQLFGVGDYTTIESFGNVGNDNIESILVGTDVLPTLFMNQDLSGRGDTISSNDSNLSDNRIGSNTTSSIKVQNRDVVPRIPLLVWPNYSAVHQQGETLSFSVDNLGAGMEFQFRININQNENLDSAWLSSPNWYHNGLPDGKHTWQARSRNENAVSSWSSIRYFYIQASDPDTHALSAPYFDDMESPSTQWTHSGSWRKTNQVNQTQDGGSSWIYNNESTGTYDSSNPNFGHLTSPPIQLPHDDKYYLRFWYRYETESDNIHWDQRLIQVSVDGGPFEELFQLHDDKANKWLRIPVLSLANYSGKTVQFRLNFSTLDEAFNDFQGWAVDDFSITTTSPPYCPDSDDDPSNAAIINYGESREGIICPAGDVDYYKFNGEAGDQIGVNIASKYGESNESYSIYLLDGDGNSILKTSDDSETTSEGNSNLFYKLNRDGLYFIKVKSWNHPTGGGHESTYAINIIQDNGKPEVQFISPQASQRIFTGPITLSVTANDTISGISHVSFFWHPSDWENDNWIYLGDDRDGSDSWSLDFSIPHREDPSQIAFFAHAYDYAGNTSGAAYWNLEGTSLYFP